MAAFAFFPWSCALLHLRAELAPELVEQGKVTKLSFPWGNKAKRESLSFSQGFLEGSLHSFFSDYTEQAKLANVLF